MGFTTEYFYDANGNKIKERDAKGNETAYEYDNKIRLIKVIDVLGHSIQYEYDSQDNKIKETDKKGNKTEYFYDGLKRLIKVKNAKGEITETSYNNINQKIWQSDPKGNKAYFHYDKMGRITKSVDSLGRENKIEYDYFGNKTKVIDSENRWIEYKYDKLNRLTEVKNAKYSTYYKYDGLGNKTEEIDGKNNSQKWVYDNNNRVKTIKDAAGKNTIYTYDKLDNVTSIRDKAGNLTAYQYDANYRKTTEIIRGGAQIKYEYDNVGNLIKKTDEEETITEYEYNNRYELTTVKKPEGEIKYQYDSEGNVTEVEDLAGKEKYFYDSLNRLIEKELNYSKLSTNENLMNGYKIKNEYDINGNITKLKLPSGVEVNYNYNKNNWLTDVTALNKTIATYSYDKTGKNKESIYGNGTKNIYFYDDIGRLTTLEILGKFKDNGSTAEGMFFSDHYEYDNANNRIKKIALDDEITKYSYDKNYQLTGIDYKFTGSLKYDQTYTYDSMGNRLHMKYKYGEIEYQYSAVNYELKRYAINTHGITKYEYDKRGNTIRKINQTGNQKNNEFEYTFDSENRLTKVWHKNHKLAKKLKGSSSQNNIITEMEYFYNSSGMRIAVKEPGTNSSVIPANAGISRYYIYSGNNVLAELNEQGKITSEFIYGLEKTARIDHPKPVKADSLVIPDSSSVIPAGAGIQYKLTYFHNDTIGSAAILTTDTGFLLQECHYDPFGSIIFARGKDGNKYRFAGKEYDKETGLSYFGARFYDPLTGRFISRDPVKQDFSPITHNPYPYCANNPLKYVDPNGEFFWIAIAAAVFVGVGSGSDWFTDFEHFDWEKAFAGAALTFTSIYSFGTAATAATGGLTLSSGLGLVGSTYGLISTSIQIVSGEGLTLGAGLSALATFGLGYAMQPAMGGIKGGEKFAAQMFSSLVSTGISISIRAAADGTSPTTDQILQSFGMSLGMSAVSAGVGWAEESEALGAMSKVGTRKPPKGGKTITKVIDGITVIGDQDFIDEVELSMNRLKNVDNRFKDILTKLKGKGFSIVESWGGSQYLPHLKGIAWDRSQISGGDFGTFTHQRIGLAHEFGHAYSHQLSMEGKISAFSSLSLPQKEGIAVYYENVARKYFYSTVKVRTSYDNFPRPWTAKQNVEFSETLNNWKHIK